MNQIFSFIQKEIHHILRDQRTLFILLIMPIVQIILYGFALSNEVKNSSFAYIDYDKSSTSRGLLANLNASKYFDEYSSVKSSDELEILFRQNKIKLGIIIPKDFEKNIYSKTATQLQLLADGADPNVGNTVINYATQISNRYLTRDDLSKIPMKVEPVIRYLYNPQLQSSFNFVPGVMAMILMLVSTMMTAVSIVREKELGTMEVMLVSPMQPLKVIISKMIPYFFVSFLNIINIILMSVYVLHLPIKGNIGILLLESSLFIITCLSFGFFISTKSAKQETAMFISLIGLFLPTLMLSGYMFPIENLPVPMQFISNLVPARWYYSILKAVMLKGLGFQAIWKENLVLLSMILVLLFFSIKNFKLRLE